jgi:hypothetical protein
VDHNQQEQIALHRWAVIAEAAGYKLTARERGRWSARSPPRRTRLRPVCHQREDRIRAHVLLCWLALLLIGVAETTVRRILDLEPDPRRAPAPARRHLHGPGRDLPADHRAGQTPARHPDRPGPGPAEEDHRDQPEALTSTFASA